MNMHSTPQGVGAVIVVVVVVVEALPTRGLE